MGKNSNQYEEMLQKIDQKSLKNLKEMGKAKNLSILWSNVEKVG